MLEMYVNLTHFCPIFFLRHFINLLDEVPILQATSSNTVTEEYLNK
jgi:hypothetical protein